MVSAPPNASKRNGSLNACNSKSCISSGLSWPFRYFSISSFKSSAILLHAYFQIPFPVLNVALYLIQIKSGEPGDILIAFLLQEEELNTSFLLFCAPFDTLRQFNMILLFFRLVLQIQKVFAFHKPGR